MTMIEKKLVRVSILLVLLILMAIAIVQANESPAAKVQKARETLSVYTQNADLTDEQLHEMANALNWLTWFGTEDSVKEIIPLLADERLGTQARTALINIPGEAGRKALRESLDSLSGLSLVGVILSLGEMKDEASREKLVELTESDDKTVAEAARSAVAKLDAVPVEPFVFEAVEPVEPVKPIDISNINIATILKTSLTDESDIEKLNLWSQVVSPDAKSIELLLNVYESYSPENVPGPLADSLELLCKRTFEPSAAVNVLKKAFARSSPEQKCFLISLFVQIGNNDALEQIARSAGEKEERVIDAATRVLGEWINMDAAPFLILIAEKHSLQKYRIRAVRGYLRLVRQMGATPDTKIQMADAIVPFVEREEEKRLLAELYSQIENERTDRLLFDGKTFNGWEGDTEKTFRIENDAIVGGSLETLVPQNMFLCSTERFRDFTLTLECKIVGEGGNAGIQFRSERIPDHNEMIGYQADMTSDGLYWGRLYDESRRNDFLAETDTEMIKKIWKPNDWNQYKIVCWGNRVKLYLNNILTVDYKETDPNVPLDGVIGLQIHGGAAGEASYRNIRIERYTRSLAE
ncbi:MAG: DUF1080 domain-containing protein [Planctomycetia bacterium]|nr:DUF1080 domain-containing protein [Planctomycetia bacterium]